MAINLTTLIQKGRLKPVILGGGYGGRLNAVCDPQRNRYPIAKAVVPIGSKRSIDYSLDPLKKIGLDRAFITVWHLAHTIERIVRPKDGFRPEYISERYQDPLDTAGPVASVAKNRDWDSNQENIILVQSSDIVHNVPLDLILENHLSSGAAATITVNRYPWDQIHRFGTVRLKGMPERKNYRTEIEFEDAVGTWIRENQNASAKIVEFQEKRPRFDNDQNDACLSNLTNSSIYIFNALVLRTLLTMMTKKGKEDPLFPDLYQPGGPVPFSDWGRHIFKWLSQPENQLRFPLNAFIIPDQFYWRDVGFGEDIRQVNMDVLAGKIDGGLDRFHREAWGWRGHNVYIDPSARIDNSLIADNCIIGPKVRIDNSVIGENSQIGQNSRLYRSVVFPAPYEREGPNIIKEDSLLNECLFLGGKLDKGSSFERKMVYSPAGGGAIDSLTKKIEII
ncbi:MAG: NDP-sugar synthase [Candidatus Margulisiibacteriota bacterium]|nr:NDP-sugar synthase [Candidatus Margulisiibacteriota bacterium]